MGRQEARWTAAEKGLGPTVRAAVGGCCGDGGSGCGNGAGAGACGGTAAAAVGAVGVFVVVDYRWRRFSLQQRGVPWSSMARKERSYVRALITGYDMYHTHPYCSTNAGKKASVGSSARRPAVGKTHVL